MVPNYLKMNVQNHFGFNITDGKLYNSNFTNPRTTQGVVSVRPMKSEWIHVFWYVLRVFVEVLTISELEYLQYVLKYVFINLQFPPSVTCFTTLFTTTWIKSSCYSFIAFSVYCISHHWSQHFDLKMLSGLKDDADDVDLSPHVPELVMDFSKVLCFE